MHASELIVLGGVVVAGFFCQWISWRLRVPSILLLLLAGFLAGPVLGWLDPDALFGDLLRPIVALAVAVILYEGSVTLRFSEIRGHGAVVRNLVTLGVLVTWVTATLAAWLFLGWDIYLATLFGAIVTVSGPTVIVP
ncbi:MAG: cation:proton antiporter, partial [Lysobacterales bacterium]